MIIKKNRKIIRASSDDARRRSYIRAAEDDFEVNDDLGDVDDADGVIDALDDLSDNVGELQDAVDGIAEDQVDIAINNNIADHFIAECDRCNGIFISAVVDSDQELEYVSGVCPLCGRETEQYLKWIIRSVE